MATVPFIHTATSLGHWLLEHFQITDQVCLLYGMLDLKPRISYYLLVGTSPTSCRVLISCNLHMILADDLPENNNVSLSCTH